MTDETLIQLLQAKTPEELSLDEVRYLKKRLGESPELRQTLSEQLEMEQYLCEALGRIDVSVDDIIARAGPPQGGTHPALLAVGLIICLGLVGFITAVMVMATSGPHDDVPLAHAKGTDEATTATDDSAEGDQADVDPADDADDKEDKPDELPGDAPDEADVPAPEPTQDPPADPPPVDNPDEENPGDEVVEKKPAGPWQPALSQPPRPLADTWFVDFDTDKQVPSKSDLEKWFDRVSGQRGAFRDENVDKVPYGRIEGLVRLKAPWPEDAVLKFSVAKLSDLRIHFFAGQQGVSVFQYQRGDHQRWAAYATTREKDKPVPASLALAATDDARDIASEVRYGPTVTIHWHDGDLVVMRGDVQLLRAALPLPPEDVFFEGETTLRGIAMYRGEGFPQRQGDYPVVADFEHPAELSWLAQLPEKNAAWQKLDDGRVRLTANRADPLPHASAALPQGGIQVVDVLLEDFTAGTGVYLGTPKTMGEGDAAQPAAAFPPNEVLTILQNRQDKKLSARWGHFDINARDDDFGKIDEKLVPQLGERVWVRFLLGAGVMRCWISPNGQDWARLFQPGNGKHAAISQLGVFCGVNMPDCGITVGRIIVRRLPVVNSLVEDQLLNRAQAFSQHADVGTWLADVAAHQPEDVSFADWRLACALRTVGHGSPVKLSQGLLDLILKDPQAKALPVAQRLQLADEVALLIDPYTNTPDNKAFDLPGRYRQIGREAFAAGEPRPYSLIRRPLMSQPASLRQPFKALDGELIREEILSLAYGGQWQQLAKLSEQLRFFAGREDYLRANAPLALWGEALAARHLPHKELVELSRLRGDWQHPFVEEFSKEAYSVMAEFHAAVESESYEDAAKTIASIDPGGTEGLLPSSGDPQLFVSVPTAVSCAMQQDEKLKAAMNEQFGALARLRIRQAITAGDAANVELATIQFYGTEAVGEAHRWLGDRALAGGQFTEALAHYERVLQKAGLLQKREVEPRMRLAAAMMGHDFGQPVTHSVQFGELEMTSAEFESLVKEMQTHHKGSGGVLPGAAEQDAAESGAPQESGFEFHARSRFDGDSGERPNDIPGHARNLKVPWMQRQMSVATTPDTAYVSNRFHVAAYDLANGNRKWQSQRPPGDRSRTHEWPLVPMQVEIAGDRLFARLLNRQGPVLVCLDRNNGQLVWHVLPTKDHLLVGDPLVAQDRVFCLSLQRDRQQEDLLRLSSYALDTGEPIDSRPLVRLRSNWWDRKICRATRVGDAVVCNLGGLILSFDFSGTVRWARRQVLLPPSEDPNWVAQRMDAPLVHNSSVVVAGPGVQAIECFDWESGQLQWRNVQSDLRRLVGIVEGKAIVYAGDSYIALDAETGHLAWRHTMPSTMEAELGGAKGKLLVARRVAVPGRNDRFFPELVWIDAATGDATVGAPLTKLEEADPFFGPFISTEDRLWSFFGRGIEDANRDVVELKPQGEAQPLPTWMAKANEDVWLEHLPADVREGVVRVLPQWTLLEASRREPRGLIADAHGQKDVLTMAADGSAPLLLARRITIPKQGSPKLNIDVGNEANQNWSLQVEFGDNLLWEQELAWQKNPTVWKKFSVDLTPARGQTAWLIIRGKFKDGGDHVRTYWKPLKITF